MKLKSIKVNTYRSIVNQKVEISQNCLGFIGLNESGKSNILNAIQHLEPRKNLTADDTSKINGKEASIEYIYEVSKNQQKRLLESVNEALLSLDSVYGEEKVILDLSINSFIFHNYYEPKTSKSEKPEKFVIDFNFKLNKDYKSLDKSLSETLIDPTMSALSYLVVHDNKEYDIQIDDLIHENLLIDIAVDDDDDDDDDVTYFIDSNYDDVKAKLSEILIEELKKLQPSVHYWTYNSKYLIPAEITYSEFIEDNDPYSVNAPLYNMLMLSDDLELYDTKDVLEKIKSWKKDSSLRRKDSKILTRDINNHIKSIWKDYDQDLNIALEADTITIHVNDPKSSSLNYYDMTVRSQGFKTFISFILTISAEVKKGIIENSVIILDEPETHLHPSGVRYMKEELLKLSDYNYVFYATHSIFMIDRSNLLRHIIVKKEHEITKLTQVKLNNIIQEEVIYEALGTQLDEFSISSKNIVFEGELDLELLKFFRENCLYKKDNEELMEYQLHNGGGTNNIQRFFSNKILPKQSKWVFILDNDPPGRNLAQNLEKKSLKDNYNNFEFKQYSNTRDYELEDILEPELVSKAFEDAIDDVDEKFKFDINQEKPFSKICEEYYSKNKISKGDKAIIEEAFKNNLSKEVMDSLDKINKETSIPKRFKLFCKEFPGYFNFIKNIDLFNIKFPED